MASLDNFARSKLASLRKRAWLRTLATTSPEEGGVWVSCGQRRLLSFSGNDYLNLSQHPDVKRAAIAAIERYGVGSGSSRLITGDHPLFTELEARLAKLKQTESACVFGSGYLANIGIIPALIGANDTIFVDALAHSCIWAGAAASGATVHTFRHNDVGHLSELLSAHRGRRNALIATDGVFSMDGDLAPLPELAEVAARCDAWLLSDDAHGLGVVGNGRGSSFAFGPKPDIPLQMGTLSKAVGSYGGYLCASRDVVDFIKSRAASFIYSTALPAAVIAAAIAALDIIERNPEFAASSVAKARGFAAAAGLPMPASPIVPLIIGGAEEALAASRLLEDEGFLVTAIRPPTVPLGTSRLRFTFTAGHDDADIARLADAVAKQLRGPLRARS